MQNKGSSPGKPYNGFQGTLMGKYLREGNSREGNAKEPLNLSRPYRVSNKFAAGGESCLWVSVAAVAFSVVLGWMGKNEPSAKARRFGRVFLMLGLYSMLSKISLHSRQWCKSPQK